MIQVVDLVATRTAGLLPPVPATGAVESSGTLPSAAEGPRIESFGR
jgi:hypothetical protein